MRKTLLILLFAFFTRYTSVKAQNVYIPDANFKSLLLISNINLNGDNEIQVSEAAAFTGTINVSYQNIYSLTGIGAFTSLTVLKCAHNLLSTLNVSTNTALTFLECFDNGISSLNVSMCPSLTYLGCHNNSLTNLNVSANPALTELYCANNNLTSLNASSTSSLVRFNCENNQLTSLNIQNGNNNNLTLLSTGYNINLTCIQVDDIAYMNTNWPYAKDTWASYNVSCSVGLTENVLNTTVDIYPNPTTGVVRLSDYYNVQVTDIAGKVLFEKQIANGVDLSNQPSGMYFISLGNSKGEFIQRSKIIKE